LYVTHFMEAKIEVLHNPVGRETRRGRKIFMRTMWLNRVL
jgi:hypothetical protein